MYVCVYVCVYVCMYVGVYVFCCFCISLNSRYANVCVQQACVYAMQDMIKSESKICKRMCAQVMQTYVCPSDANVCVPK